MAHFWNRWKRNSDKRTTDKPLAQLNLKIYADRLEYRMTGDEVKVGGAIVTLMLRHPHTHAIINNAVVATNRELARREAEAVYADLVTTFNPN